VARRNGCIGGHVFADARAADLYRIELHAESVRNR